MGNVSPTQNKPKSQDCAWDFSGCKNLNHLSSKHLKSYFDRLIKLAGLTFIDSIFYKFGDGGEGISYVAVIGESHVAIHSWPEDRYLQLTIDYCNHSQNNDEKAVRLQRYFRKFFKPKKTETHLTRERGVPCPVRKSKTPERLLRAA